MLLLCIAVWLVCDSASASLQHLHGDLVVQIFSRISGLSQAMLVDRMWYSKLNINCVPVPLFAAQCSLRWTNQDIWAMIIHELPPYSKLLSSRRVAFLALIGISLPEELLQVRSGISDCHFRHLLSQYLKGSEPEYYPDDWLSGDMKKKMNAEYTKRRPYQENIEIPWHLLSQSQFNQEIIKVLSKKQLGPQWTLQRYTETRLDLIYEKLVPKFCGFLWYYKEQTENENGSRIKEPLDAILSALIGLTDRHNDLLAFSLARNSCFRELLLLKSLNGFNKFLLAECQAREPALLDPARQYAAVADMTTALSISIALYGNSFFATKMSKASPLILLFLTQGLFGAGALDLATITLFESALSGKESLASYLVSRGGIGLFEHMRQGFPDARLPVSLLSRLLIQQKQCVQYNVLRFLADSERRTLLFNLATQRGEFRCVSVTFRLQIFHGFRLEEYWHELLAIADDLQVMLFLQKCKAFSAIDVVKVMERAFHEFNACPVSVLQQIVKNLKELVGTDAWRGIKLEDDRAYLSDFMQWADRN